MKTPMLFTLAALATVAWGSAASADPVPAFRAAKPAWPAGRETERNLLAGFRAVFEAPTAGPVMLRATGSTSYRVFLNGEFLAHGPARTARGFFRVDEWDLRSRLRPGRNVVAFEVAGYNVNSFALLDQPSFLQAEVVAGDAVLAATAGSGFEAQILPERVQKVQRYSFQRPFSEIWRLTPGFDRWRADPSVPMRTVDCAPQPGGRLLPRRVDLPDYAIVAPVRVVSEGEVETGRPVEKPWKDRALTQIGPKLGGYPEAELASIPSLELQGMAVRARTPVDRPFDPAAAAALGKNGFRILDFGTNLTGFIGATIRCAEPCRVVLTFDEMLSGEGDVDWKRLHCVNIVDVTLEPGEYAFESYEPYTLRYLQATVLAGACELRGAHLREFASAGVGGARFAASDPALARIFEAGRQTFRQNALDIFMDCPSRERAGWLCDSFFTSRSAVDLQGHARIERAFLENFAVPETFVNLPDGMLPMCYPSDHANGQFIPNWAMWFVLELREYLARSGDRETIEALRPRVLKLVEYFRQFRNTDGLLEKLPSWVFVEWSKANSFVQDVNYPSNMLYAETLDAVAELYDVPELAAEARAMRETIRRQSFDGTFFVDNALRRPDGSLHVTTNRTETCQYYAFFFHVASPATHSNLWTMLVDEFGPQRKGTDVRPEIHPSNQLMGNVMRFELLSDAGMCRRVLAESVPYQLKMVDLTGTLWEHDSPQASCNHGFASHGGVRLLFRDALGLKSVDAVNRRVTLRFTDVPLEWCEGRMPVADGAVELRWQKADGRIRYRVSVPSGTTVAVENLSGLDLVREP